MEGQTGKGTSIQGKRKKMDSGF
uniref:Uncharacterized protein n=1 Tax=Arundo donax TaxID=35708 RepID=A0A0A8ZXZ4_ARUDO